MPSRRYLAYGSSITHGGDAVRPTGTYAMGIARALGCDLINLGFAGSAQMDIALAHYIANREDWDFATIEMGINVIDSWDTATFAGKVGDFLTVLASRRPDRWLFITDLYLNRRDFDGSGKVKEYREAVQRAVHNLAFRRAVYIPGTRIVRSAPELTSDLVHPSAAGHEAMAARWVREIESRLNGEA
ncbi:GDSL-type esterase/lipase family protein [Paenibacillus sp. P26]|nr:GDSL-type esterase/lipase family protein [Paenibacillus sp. P26]